MSSDSLLYEVALGLLPGVGDLLTRQLISYCGSAKAVFTTPKGKLLKIPGIGPTFVQNFNPTPALQQAETTIKLAEEQQVQLLFYTNPAYPNRLKHLADAPCLLFYKGNVDLNHSKMVSIVGTRQATDYGRRITEKIVTDLQKHQPVIVSGLAYGIDILAHRAAVAAGLPTLGIMASGPDIIYPAVHRKTAEKMLENGGLITENTFGTKPDAPRFPARNRIIAGLGDCTIIVEAAIKGGALITADIAHSYNRDVMAVPGNIDNAVSEGCNFLIKTNKAAIYTELRDLEELLNWDNALAPSTAKFSKASLYNVEEFEPDEWQIIKLLLSMKEELIDNIAWKVQIPVSRLASVLLGLEFKGVVKSLPGKKYALV
ncbi:DNA-protecting protein DprA [Adhaeribacter swui]|uniref:DNA-protecting protein DprA n=1 Tax=Adhaeribacter swui TaxID=2086471 RepID=A0A7G7GDG4_9BACT|nr:DNA-processing protein DprA [Adhaeribacter swui]QNF35198.1 DNA-protecting protein DprA [Adhaeribacter swui]